MELQLGGKHIIINEAERIAAVNSHVRTGVAISELYLTSPCAIGGVRIASLDIPLRTESRDTEPPRGEVRVQGEVVFVFEVVDGLRSVVAWCEVTPPGGNLLRWEMIDQRIGTKDETGCAVVLEN